MLSTKYSIVRFIQLWSYGLVYTLHMSLRDRTMHLMSNVMRSMRVAVIRARRPFAALGVHAPFKFYGLSKPNPSLEFNLAVRLCHRIVIASRLLSMAITS